MQNHHTTPRRLPCTRRRRPVLCTGVIRTVRQHPVRYTLAGTVAVLVFISPAAAAAFAVILVGLHLCDRLFMGVRS
jgi:hypothetical protein